MMDHPQPLLLYDGTCGVCSWAVRFLLRHDRRAQFHFAALGSNLGRQLLASYGITSRVDSLVLIDGDRALVRSAAVFATLQRLGGPWHLLRIGQLLPRRWTDALYDLVARRRTRISARLGLSCQIPAASDRSRMLG